MGETNFFSKKISTKDQHWMKTQNRRRLSYCHRSIHHLLWSLEDRSMNMTLECLCSLHFDDKERLAESIHQRLPGGKEKFFPLSKGARMTNKRTNTYRNAKKPNKIFRKRDGWRKSFVAKVVESVMICVEGNKSSWWDGGKKEVTDCLIWRPVVVALSQRTRQPC